LLVTRPGEPVGHQLLVNIEMDRGRLDLAIPHALDQLETNPDSYSEYHQLADLYARLEDRETAQAWYERTPEAVQTSDYLPFWLYATATEVHRLEAQYARDVELYQGWDGGQRGYVNALFLSGKVEEGVAAAIRYEEAFETLTGAVGRAVVGTLAARVGEHELAERMLKLARDRNEVLQKAGYDLESTHVADAVLALAKGDSAEAIAALRRSLDAGDLSLPYYRIHSVWDPLRAEPEFGAFIAAYEQKLTTQRERLKEQGL
jgi:tetratricopeptide (TPR) repeat protein